MKSLLFLLPLVLIGCDYRITREKTFEHLAQQGSDLVVVGKAIQQGANPKIYGGIVASKGEAILKLVDYEVEE